MTLEEFEKIAKDIEAKSDFIISWWAKNIIKQFLELVQWTKRVAEPGNRVAKIYLFLGRCNQ